MICLLYTSGRLESLEPKKSKRGLIAVLVIAVILLLAAAAVFFILRYYHVENVYVEGNVHYTNEEIIQIVTSERFGDNSIFLYLKYRNKSITGIPFIESMDIEVMAPDTIKIIVYEKSIAGYVEYLDR